MGMIMSRKILATHVGFEEVKAGQLIEVDLDLVLGNDIASLVAINEMKKMDRKTVFDKDRITLVTDHFIPSKDTKSAEDCKCYREFAYRHEVTDHFDVGEMRIEHALLSEKGLVVTGDVTIGASSHICTHEVLGAFSTGMGNTDMTAGMMAGRAWSKVLSAIKSELMSRPSKWVSSKGIILHIIGMIGADGALYKPMEFVGEGIRNLSMDDRFTIYSAAIEAGGENGIFPVDELTVGYMREHSKCRFTAYKTDEDAEYDETYVIDLSQLKPIVSFPHPPSNTRIINQAGDAKVDRTVIGSCTSGQIKDMRIAAEVLKGRKVTKDMRCIVVPVTQSTYLQAVKKELLEIFTETGAVVSTPTYDPCLGGYMDILTTGGRYISTTNQNFVGHMGRVDSEVYLVSPAVAAASAMAGKIVCPYQLD